MSISLGRAGQCFGLPDRGRNSLDFERKWEVAGTMYGSCALCQTLSWSFCIWDLVQSSEQGWEVG